MTVCGVMLKATMKFGVALSFILDVVLLYISSIHTRMMNKHEKKNRHLQMFCFWMNLHDIMISRPTQMRYRISKVHNIMCGFFYVMTKNPTPFNSINQIVVSFFFFKCSCEKALYRTKRHTHFVQTKLKVSSVFAFQTVTINTIHAQRKNQRLMKCNDTVVESNQFSFSKFHWKLFALQIVHNFVAVT